MRNRNTVLLFLGVLGITVLAAGSAQAGDWPTYRHDNARSAVTEEALDSALHLQWVFTPPLPPVPAWSDPRKEKPRVRFDEAYHVVTAGNGVYFGSSADGKVYCLDRDTGEVRWTFRTQGPVRVAPTLAGGKVYVGSDDGYAYCLNGEDGALVWRYRAGFTGEMLIGNNRMISRWPIRTGVMVDGGTAFFGAGVFPHDTTFLYAVDAATGDLVWVNDTYGQHGYKLEFGGISPQGPLLATPERVFVPSGRAMPAAFDRATGEFQRYLSPGGKVGGTWALLSDTRLVSGMESKRSYDLAGRPHGAAAYAWFPGLQLVVKGPHAYMLTADELKALNREAFKEAEKEHERVVKERAPLAKKHDALKRNQRRASGEKAEKIKAEMAALAEQIAALDAERSAIEENVTRWTLPSTLNDALMLAGETLVVGGENAVAFADTETGATLWEAPVEGRACGLAAANGCLYVSTDNGKTFCFGPKPGELRATQLAAAASPWPADETAAKWEKEAQRILTETGIDRGYCLVYGCDTGQLAYELARASELHICVVDEDEARIKAVRAALDATGLYGSRIVAHHAPKDALPYADYFANLVVSERSDGLVESEMQRVMKPCGGTVCYGPTTLTRGALEGAGKWTHQYADAANTACSDDQVVKGALRMLWYGEPGSGPMVERHARAAAPLAMDGRLFVQGENTVMAYDAYNGLKLWHRDIPGAVRVRVDSDMSNFVMDQDAVYVAVGDRCLRLDPASGETLAEYGLPEGSETGHRWGYLAVIDGMVYGTAAPPLREDYGLAWDSMVCEDGTWTDFDAVDEGRELPASYRYYLDQYRSRHETPDEQAFWEAQQSGFMWHPMHSWPAWGSVDTPQGAVTERIMASTTVFALDAASGELRWRYTGQAIAHPAIAIGDGVLFLADCGISEAEKQAALEERAGLIDAGTWEEAKIGFKPANADVRRVVALDAQSGEPRWERVMDLTGCGGDRMGLAYRTADGAQDGILCFFGCFSNHDRELFKEGKLQWRRVTAIGGQDGADLWSRPLDYLRRPVVIGDKVLIEPRMCSVTTGAVQERAHPLTDAPSTWEFVRPGHCCSVSSACPNMFFLRGYFLWYYDLLRDQGMLPFGGIRPGCWINTIPANGLVLFPEAAAGCGCSYPIRCTVALKPEEELRTWSVCIQNGDRTPVKHLAINFGAPGDWRDDAGRMWFAYPHPPSSRWLSYGVNFKLKTEIAKEGGYFHNNFLASEWGNTDTPWLLTSGCEGATSMRVPLLDEGQKPAKYTIRMHFAEHEDVKPGERVFSVRVQGKQVFEDLDIAAEAGGAKRGLIKEAHGIKVKDALEISFEPKDGESGKQPLLCGLEVLREGAKIAGLR